jgi:protein translocase SEC61 complex gamma subunit
LSHVCEEGGLLQGFRQVSGPLGLPDWQIACPLGKREADSHINTSARKVKEFPLSLRDFLRSMASVIKLSRKSDKEEFFLYLKLVLLGLGVVGVIGFLIKLISAALPSIFG